MSPRETAEQLYSRFQKRDGAGMAALYAPNATFNDPVFQNLSGAEAGAMWRMLCGRATDLDVHFTIIDVTTNMAMVNWTARYSFGPKRRPVVNHIQSSLNIENGLIVEQIDTFDFPKWATQALGLFGRMFGSTAFLRARVQKNARQGLVAFMDKERSGAGAK